ncbi:MAG: fibronectin type III domain-containing protein [Gammaproteobacteria bacterium]
MTLSQLPKYLSSQVLFALFLMLQISACSNEDIAKTIANDASAGTLETTETTDIPVSTASADINLSWTAPSEREDNEPISLSEIAGYKVYYGTSERNYTESVDINDGSADGYTFKNFEAGTYYFALTTYDTAGRESQYSAEVVIVV